MAGLLSGMAWDWADSRFQVVLAVTAGLALLSGGIQAAAYAGHMENIIAAVIVGLALPVIGELGVALAVSAYSQAQRRQRMTDAQTQLAEGVRSQIGDAIATIDPTKIRAQVDRAATLVTKAIVDSTIADMIAELQRTHSQDATRQPATSATDSDQPPLTPEGETEQAREIAEPLRASVEAMNAERQRLIAERRAAILQLFQTYGQMGAIELQKRLQDDRGIEASERTVRLDLAALETSGDLRKVGRGAWDLSQPIATMLPALSAPVLNGHGHK
ncbi:MAG: hypothetical protein KF832_25165 [Caldilineaceae bacterium]|nr:hypothetical protein [Caldilineaceae bacterium]